MIKSPGQVAFEAYNESKGGLTWDGKPIPPWNEVGDPVRDGWEASANAVIQNLGEATTPLTVREWQARIHGYAKDKGWWDEKHPRSFGDLCMLFVTEIAEAYEEFRSHKGFDEVYFNPEKPGKPEGIPTELADCVIRIIDWFGAMGIDLQSILEQKHTYNQTRAYRHGNRKV